MFDDPPKDVEQTLERLKAILPDLPKRMRQCADYVYLNIDQVAFSTVAQLAARAQVQPSAMMRFCSLLGFSGYTQMQRVFRQKVSRVAPDYATRLANLRAKDSLTTHKLLASFVEAGRFSLEKLAHDIDEENLERAAKMIAQAQLTHIVGYRRAFPVAACLSYMLDKLTIPSVFHDDVGKVGKFNAVRKNDTVVAITFAPYTAGTIEFIEFALQRKAQIIVITDSEISPANMDGVCLLKVVDLDVGDFRSLSASINLAMALAVSAGSQNDEALTLKKCGQSGGN